MNKLLKELQITQRKEEIFFESRNKIIKEFRNKYLAM